MKFRKYINETITTLDVNINPDVIDNIDMDIDIDDSDINDFLAIKWIKKMKSLGIVDYNKEEEQYSKNLLDIKTKNFKDIFSNWKKWLDLQNKKDKDGKDNKE